MFGSTEISRKYICYAKFSEEFKSGRKIGGNFARKEVILQFVYSLLILVNTLATFTLEISHFIVFHIPFEYKSARQTNKTVIIIYLIYVV